MIQIMWEIQTYNVHVKQLYVFYLSNLKFLFFDAGQVQKFEQIQNKISLSFGHLTVNRFHFELQIKVLSNGIQINNNICHHFFFRKNHYSCLSLMHGTYIIIYMWVSGNWENINSWYRYFHEYLSKCVSVQW